MKGNNFVSKQSKVEVIRKQCCLAYSLFCDLFSRTNLSIHCVNECFLTPFQVDTHPKLNG